MTITAVEALPIMMVPGSRMAHENASLQGKAAGQGYKSVFIS